MNLIIDIGNTRTKYSVFDKDIEVFSDAVSICNIDRIRQLKSDFPKISNAIISSTGLLPEGIIDGCKKIFNFFLKFNPSTPLPFSSDYKTPTTIGADRLAGIAGAQKKFPDKNVLIIDAGTAITFDLKTKTNIHKGGNISPGLKMRFKSLHEYTHALPLVEATDISGYLGLSTREAILNGVILGMMSEIEGTIDLLSPIYEDLTIILTGGDAPFFEIRLKRTIFVIQNLVSQGLNSILNYNVPDNLIK